MRAMILAAALSLTGCATVAGQTAKPPKFEATTARSTAQFQSCFSTVFERQHYRPVFTPKEGGGMFAYAINGTLVWTMNIIDDGAARRVLLYAAADQEIVSRIRSCL
jgi:hypothetical protein